MISPEEIQHLAELSRLQLTDAEVAGLQKDFDAILGYVGQIGGATTEDASGETAPVHNVMRADEPRAADEAMADKEASILAAAPRREGDYFVVRKIIEKDE